MGCQIFSNNKHHNKQHTLKLDRLNYTMMLIALICLEVAVLFKQLKMIPRHSLEQGVAASCSLHQAYAEASVEARSQS